MGIKGLFVTGVCFLALACSDSDDGDGTADAGSGGSGTGGGSSADDSGAMTGGRAGSGGSEMDSGTMGMEAGDAMATLDPADYSEESNWLCRPGLDDNECDAELSVTEVLPDGTTMASDLPSAAESDVDCFYVYPTVDLDLTAAVNRDFPDIDRDNILDPLWAQAAPFRDVCNLYAPLYRQASIGAYLGDPTVLQEKLGFAFADVVAAFEYYLENFNEGRPFVLMGHSQGAMMLTLLIQTQIDSDEALREQLVAALLIGTLGFFTVPEGEVAGGSFMNVPLCTDAEENGCVVTYNTFADGYPPTDTYGAVGGMAMEDSSVGCTHPGTLGDGAAMLQGSLIPTEARQDLFKIGLDFGTEVDTYFALYRDFFTGECVEAANGQPYLEISATPGTDDTRTNPVPFDDPNLDPAQLGLHLLDYSFPSEDLKALIEAKAGAR